MAKKMLFTVIALFLVYQSVELMKFLWVIPNTELHWSLQLLMGALLNLFITGVFAFPGFVFPTNRLIGDKYYHVTNPVLIQKAYKALGIKYFRVFLMAAIWGKEKNRKVFFDGTRNGLENLMYQTKQAEFGHFGALVIIAACTILLSTKGHFLIAASATVVNIVFNLYPVLLQRYHRIQLQRINTRFSSNSHS